jgi:hypothetical protein
MMVLVRWKLLHQGVERVLPNLYKSIFYARSYLNSCICNYNIVTCTSTSKPLIDYNFSSQLAVNFLNLKYEEEIKPRIAFYASDLFFRNLF